MLPVSNLDRRLVKQQLHTPTDLLPREVDVRVVFAVFFHQWRHQPQLHAPPLRLPNQLEEATRKLLLPVAVTVCTNATLTPKQQQKSMQMKRTGNEARVTSCCPCLPLHFLQQKEI